MIRTLLATTAASVAMVGIAHAQTSADVLDTRADIAAANHEHTRAADVLEDAVTPHLRSHAIIRDSFRNPTPFDGARNHAIET